jgi:hypothetical protein
MGRCSKKLMLILAGCVVLGGGITSLAVFGRSESDSSAVYFRAVVALKSPVISEEGDFWVGDVAELYRLGMISKDVAEADTAPIKPLVEKPKPFRGYFVRAMESAPSPSLDNPGTISLKGKTKSRGTSAFCIYPAEGGKPERYVYIVCPWGIFRKPSEGNKPILAWPIGDARHPWAIVD